ncbi:MAG: response regulator [Verrucomicrobia bacterium]|nr:MAG: response regulator [Verrucomicrobiota bacterium]
MGRQQVILVVEDDPNDIILIERAFRKARVVNPLQFVRDGDQAVDYLDGRPPFEDRERHPLPTLILLDLKLPRRSGLEVLEWLKAHPELRRIPTLVLTSSRESRDVGRAYDLGANSYLLKPVNPEDLLHIVETVNRFWLLTNHAPEIRPRYRSPE